MAAPTKAEREKREKIKELRLFTRDSFIYSELENTMDEVQVKSSIGYIFARRCALRNIPIEFDCSTINEKYIKRFLQYTNYGVENILLAFKKLQELKEIDMSTYKIYYSLFHRSFWEMREKEDPYNYTVSTLIYRDDLINVLSEQKLHDIFGDNREVADLKSYLNIYDEALTEDELEHLRQYYFTHQDEKNKYRALSMTLIERDNQMYYNKVPVTTYNHECEGSPFSIDYGVKKSRSAYVELDFSKPKEDLIAFISRIKDDFDNDHTVIENIYDILGDQNIPFQCDLKNCDIYRNTRSPKSIGGRLTDSLFIYDCKKAGLDNKYIIDEINIYWQKVKNLHRETFQLKTLQEYHKLATEYIDQEKYKCYLSGYDITKE